MLIDHLVQRGAGPTGLKYNPAYGAVMIANTKAPTWTSANYTALANEGFVQNTDVFACVSLRAKAFGGVPWLVLQKRKGGGEPKEVGPDHPLSKLIRKPNSMEGGATFFEKCEAFQQIAGNTYVYRFCVREGKPPAELWALRPDKMKVIQSGDPKQPIARYDYQSTLIIPFEPDRKGHTVMHWKTFHPIDDWYGLSPIQVASRSVDQSNGGDAWNASLVQNACRPSGALKMTDSSRTLSPEQFNRLKDQLRTNYMGSVNAGLPMLFEGGIEWQRISMTPMEMDFLQSDERATLKICSVFGVPPELIGRMANGGLNDSNFVQARRKFYLETVLPSLDVFRDMLNTWLVPLYDDDTLYLDYDRDEIEAIQEDREIVHARALDALSKGGIEVDEFRKETGREPLPNNAGKVRYLPTGITQIDEDGNTVGQPQSSGGGEGGPGGGSSSQQTVTWDDLGIDDNEPAAKPGKPQKKSLEEDADGVRGVFAAIAASTFDIGG